MWSILFGAIRHNNVEDESWCMAVAGVFTFIFDILQSVFLSFLSFGLLMHKMVVGERKCIIFWLVSLFSVIVGGGLCHASRGVSLPRRRLASNNTCTNKDTISLKALVDFFSR
jgi:hypothetical protein